METPLGSDCRSSVGAAAGCDLLILLLRQDQKIAACGSSYMGCMSQDKSHKKSGNRVNGCHFFERLD